MQINKLQVSIFIRKKIVDRLRFSALYQIVLLSENSFREPMNDLTMARIRVSLNYESLYNYFKFIVWPAQSSMNFPSLTLCCGAQLQNGLLPSCQELPGRNKTWKQTRNNEAKFSAIPRVFGQPLSQPAKIRFRKFSNQLQVTTHIYLLCLLFAGISPTRSSIIIECRENREAQCAPGRILCIRDNDSKRALGWHQNIHGTRLTL